MSFLIKIQNYGYFSTFNLRTNNCIAKDSLLDYKCTALQEVVLKMFSIRDEGRPTCAQLISQFYSWDINVKEVTESDTYNENVNQLKQFSNKFYNNYFEEKFKKSIALQYISFYSNLKT